LDLRSDILRIVTRPDFDGIVCAVLLKEALAITKPVKWVEPNRMHLGEVDIRKGDIIANLAYDRRCSLWFDHHSSNRIEIPFQGSFMIAPSAARVIYDFFEKKLKGNFRELVEAADKIDSADLNRDEVLAPEKYPYIMLADTISSMKGNDRAYWDLLVNLFRDSDIKSILQHPLVREHAVQAQAENQQYKKILQEHTRMVNRISITDLRMFNPTPTGNRFLVFSLFPESIVNIKIRRHDRDGNRLIVSVGHSIFNKTCRSDVGKLCAKFGGGGHFGAGSCSFPAADFEKNLNQILRILSS
jgi:oligoribonuclease NrnB/cAMP/cGMP phosphodiesterase (DHH superfamily)